MSQATPQIHAQPPIPMSKTSLITLLGLAAAVLIAVREESAMRAGILAGAVLGAGIGLLGFAWLCHTLKHRPAQAFNALGVGFLFHLGALLMGTIALHYAPVAKDLFDARAFAVCYATLAFIPLVFGAQEGARLASQNRTAA